MAAAIAGAGEAGHDELTQVEFGPENIRMNGDFLKAVRSGNTRLAREIILESEERTSRGETQSFAINVAPDNDTARDRTSCLRGVTIGGNTSLHIVASNGDLELVQLICSRKSSLLVACNQLRETPLHCAARAGHDQIVTAMIANADSAGGVELKTRMLRARRRDGRTALHEAAQNGHANVANSLISADGELAGMLDGKGISPLYMAVLSGSLALVQEFRQHSPHEAESTFYAGPNGQTALHAAVLYSPRYLSEVLTRPRRADPWESRFFGCSSGYEIAKEILQWDLELKKKADNSGATPLHYAASIGDRQIAKLLLKHDPSLAYISDSSGSYPIHVAAIMGRTAIIDELMLKCPDSCELLDDKGRNFFHVAVEGKNWRAVYPLTFKPALSELMNAADFDGNTPLHLAVESRKSVSTINLLVQMRRIHSNFQSTASPVLALSDLFKFSFVNQMSARDWLHKYWAAQRGGLPSPYSLHHPQHDNDIENKTEAVSEEEGLQLRAESRIVCSVLITTVTFAAAFTMPGGYKADGTPTLATRFAFKAFVITDALAFILSIVATFWLAFARTETTTMTERELRGSGASKQLIVAANKDIVVTSTLFMIAAAALMVIAFASGLYAVLAPVHTTIVAVCIPVLAAVTYIVPLGIKEGIELLGPTLHEFFYLIPRQMWYKEK
ncbi:protein ACCELERATED CELL DEATH 6-like isoform X1 [Typha angustifolia]|uniref:protein ACCELERATED CELL DEATH 6-like isoform X1 n=1 Tax=Typha angustifolia TaxID=59011 RepID=UPI003C2CEB4E